MKRQVKHQQNVNKAKQKIIFNLPQSSDSQSDYIPTQRQIGEIQRFEYDRQYYNKLRPRAIQDRQTFGHRQIIMNYPTITKQKMLKYRQKKQRANIKKDVKLVKFEHDKIEHKNTNDNDTKHQDGIKIQANVNVNVKLQQDIMVKKQYIQGQVTVIDRRVGNNRKKRYDPFQLIKEMNNKDHNYIQQPQTYQNLLSYNEKDSDEGQQQGSQFKSWQSKSK